MGLITRLYGIFNNYCIINKKENNIKFLNDKTKKTSPLVRYATYT